MTPTTALILVACGLLLYPSFLYTQVYDVEPLVEDGPECGAIESGSALHEYSGDPLNREGCQQYCRSMHGVDPYALQWRHRRTFSGGLGYSYAICLQDCDRRFWKAWDEKMDKLGKDSE
ncbi:MAG: hypothetical protein FJY85_25105 [Deltaproteobacteria bacterium]|nr:hypothetical protein [Deltaproteobacteria bacterium]